MFLTTTRGMGAARPGRVNDPKELEAVRMTALPVTGVMTSRLRWKMGEERRMTWT